MSFRSIQQNTVENSDTFSLNVPQSFSINQYPNGQWFRNPTWPALPSITSSQERVVGIYAVYPDSPFAAVTVNVTGGGTYTVDWGDGNVNTYTTGVQANYTYDFNDVDLANTNGPVTFTDSGDTVNRNNHGYQNDMPISFDSITTTTGITARQIYYVVNAATNSFQLAATVGGTPLTLTNDGNGIILPYKIAVIQIYPTSGAAFFQTTLSLNSRNSSALVNYTNGWLDLAISGRFDALNMGGTSPTNTGLLEQARILKHRCTVLTSLFNNNYKLQNIVEITADTGIVVTNASNMFDTCLSLKNIPLFDTSRITNATNMFNQCQSLQTIPLLNTSNVTNMTNMFTGCISLLSIPLFNTSSVTTMQNMLQNCTSLRIIPLLNTTNVTTMQGMFNGCISLQSIPLLNTSNVTLMGSTFANCNSLVTIPLLDTSKVTDMTSMFLMSNTLYGRGKLITIPLLNTSNVTNMNSMFSACPSLQTIPLLNMTNVTTCRAMFSGCTSLQSIPLLNMANVIDCTGMFGTCNNIQQISALNFANVNQSGNIASFSGLPSVSKNSITNVYYSWTVANNKLSGARLDEVYTNLPTVFAQGTAVTFDGTADTVTLNNHGFAAGRTVNFASITTTTGISININYFVRNVTTNTFQLSATATGAIINLVNNGSGTLNGQTITVTGNWGTATDTPSIATAKGWAVTGS